MIKGDKMKLMRFECLRCGHSWIPREERKPLVCPKCKSPYWDTIRGEKNVARQDV